ncbi:MAG: formimidoylglutamase [Bacteroidota bacterium]
MSKQLLTSIEIQDPQTETNDPRIGRLVGRALSEGDTPRAVIVGFSSDMGVQRNGGRPGASEAPNAIRKRLWKLTPHASYVEQMTSFVEHTRDLGNVEITGDVADDQQRLAEVIAPYIKKDIPVIILGGGHETAYGHYRGYVMADRPTAILNIDAHTDVRPLKEGKPHSGSPFYQALEEQKHCLRYVVAGIQPSSVSEAHLQYIKDHGGQYFLRDATNLSTIKYVLEDLKNEPLMLTLDMDAVDQAYAPGVSAPATNGISSEEWLKYAFRIAQQTNINSFDLVEVNPALDRDEQTVRLAAHTIWEILLGLSLRK